MTFDLDVAAPIGGPRYVPAKRWYTSQCSGLEQPWNGFIWMNPPFGGRNGLVPWLNRFFEHDNGIALTPDRTSAPWWQNAARKSGAFLLTRGKVKFERPDGSIGKSPGSGVTLWAAGFRAKDALYRAESRLGTVFERVLG